MSKLEKLLRKVLGGRSDANLAFEDLRVLLLHLDFQVRVPKILAGPIPIILAGPA